MTNESANPQIRKSVNYSIGTAPGRLDVMGGIADYSGSLLLQMPIRERTRVEISATEDTRDRFLIRSSSEPEVFEVGLKQLAGVPYRELGQLLRAIPGGEWAAYVIGCFAVLKEEKGLRYTGARIDIQSDVPIGKGVSSSASLEVATMHAISKEYSLQIDPLELAQLAQKVENLVVGASCGLMDQLSVELGREDHLLPIVCQPHEIFDPVPIPEGLQFLGLDSGVRHAVSGASYSDVRTACFMGYTIAMMNTGAKREELEHRINTPYGGFWANVSPDEFYSTYMPLLPVQIKGSTFLEEYGIHVDPLTSVDPERTYDVRAASFHPVAENSRIRDFLKLLTGLETAEDREMSLIAMGRLMLSSHEGYNSVGLGEPVTNRIVDLVRQKRDTGNGIYGARISGGGSGGTVTILIGSEQGYEQVLDIKRILEWETGQELKLFEGSSDGAHYIN